MDPDVRRLAGGAAPACRADADHAARRVLRWARAAVVLITVGMVAMVARVAQLKIWPADRVARQAAGPRSRTTLHARRGDILDARGRILATSRIATRLYADPKLVEDPARFARIVGDLLDYDAPGIEKTIQSRRGRRYAVLDHQLSPARLAELAPLKLPGLATQQWMTREYPQGRCAGQLLGIVGSDGRGLDGLERAFDDVLRERTGALVYLRDTRRHPLRLAGEVCATAADGDAVVLTIDAFVQTVAEEELATHCTRFGAAHGGIVVMDPANGHILAMANYPPFDPADLASSKPEQRRNRCVTDPFEPGSIFKPFLWSTAIELGLAQPQELLDCTTSGAYVSPQGRRLRDVHAHGLITWDEVLVKSSNIGMAIVGQRLGAQRMHRALGAFGFGMRSGAPFAGESAGIVNRLAKWNHYTVTSVPMGQEVAVTALQLVRAMCAIANDGLMPCPVVRLDQNAGPILERVLSAPVALYTRGVLRRVVTEGTGRKADSPLYDLFGKTGTAQVPDRARRGYAAGQYVGSFIGGAPTAAPRIVVGCFIHRPDAKKGYYGGIVAAPAVRRVIERTLPYLGVAPRPPQLDEEGGELGRRQYLTVEDGHEEHLADMRAG